jgi:hypothetical protein
MARTISDAAKARLDGILRTYTGQGENSKDKLLGAGFIILNKDGRMNPNLTPSGQPREIQVVECVSHASRNTV